MLKDRYILHIISASLSAIAVYLCFEYFFTEGKFGAPLDDTWIHFRFADNLTNGHFFQFNIGQPTSGTTSPLWVIVISLLGFISPKTYLLNSIVLSSVFYLISVIITYRISLFLAGEYFDDKKEALIFSLSATLITVFTGRFIWAGLSGMETTMFAFFSLLAVLFYIKSLRESRFSFLPAVLFALAALSRPEGYLLFCLYMLDQVMNLIYLKQLKENIAKVIAAAGIYVILTSPYLLFSYFTSGHFFPNTYRGQGGGLSLLPNIKYLQVTATFFFRDNLLTALLYFAGAVFYVINIKKYFTQFRYLNLILLWIFLLPAVSAFITPNWRHHGRYIIPILPFVNIAAIFFLSMIRNRIKPLNIRNLISKKSAPAFIVIFSLLYFGVYAVHLGKNTDNINDQQVSLANWVSENVGKDEVIALNDIGAITYLNGNKIVDMAGLVTPEILRYRTYTWDDNLDSTYLLLKNNDVKYLIIYDNWFYKFLDKYGNKFEHVHSAILKDNTICGGDTMKVYKAHLD